jgi:hypothetical protein
MAGTRSRGGTSSRSNFGGDRRRTRDQDRTYRSAIHRIAMACRFRGQRCRRTTRRISRRHGRRSTEAEHASGGCSTVFRDTSDVSDLNRRGGGRGGRARPGSCSALLVRCAELHACRPATRSTSRRRRSAAAGGSLTRDGRLPTDPRDPGRVRGRGHVMPSQLDTIRHRSVRFLPRAGVEGELRRDRQGLRARSDG